MHQDTKEPSAAPQEAAVPARLASISAPSAPKPALRRIGRAAFLALALATAAGPLAAAPLGVSADLLGGVLRHTYLLETVPDRDSFLVDFVIRIRRGQAAPAADVTFRYVATLTPQAGGRATTASLTETRTMNGIHNEVINPVIEIDPAGLVNGAYNLVLEVFHVEDDAAPDVFVLDARATIPYAKLVSFSGVLTMGTETTTLHKLSDAPPPQDNGNEQWTIVVAEGALSSGLTFSSTPESTPNLVVIRDAQGDLALLSGSAEVDDGDGTFSWGGLQGMRGVVLLSPAGVQAGDFTLQLPPGLGWRDGPQGVLNPVFESNGVALPLDSNLAVAGTASGPIPPGRQFVSDCLPVAFTPPSFTFDGQTLVLAQPGTRFLRQDLYADHFDVTGELPRSNDSYLFHLANQAASSLVVTPGPDGGISVDLSIEESGYNAHFPDADVAGADTLLRITDSMVDPAGSAVKIESVTLRYNQGCPAVGLALTQEMRIVDPFATFTPQGGLVVSGPLATAAQAPGTERRLVAGLNEDLNPVHETDPFEVADCYLPGFCAPNEGPGLEANPARFLLAEVQPGNDYALGYPGSADYAAGLGFYAGFNFLHFDGLGAGSRVGGESPFDYLLLGNAKFYSRLWGVSGLVEADPANLPHVTEIYGFPIGFTEWGFNLLGNAMLDSYIDGEIDLNETHAGFTQSMEEVRISCCGNLEDFQVPPDTDPFHVLSYWSGQRFDYSAVRFETPGACVDDRAALTYAATAIINGLPGAKAGYLRFLPDGSMTIPTDADFEPSVLALQPQDGVHGQYYFIPAGDAYFNDPASFPAGPGFVTFAGHLDVAFFENLHVRALTDANPNGDPERLTHFLQGEFLPDDSIDESHAGLPDGSTPTDYRNDSESFPNARGAFFGKEGAFEFNVKFDPVTGNFYTVEDKGADLLIVETASGVERLNAKLAQLHFGLQIEGIAQLSVGNLLEIATDYGAEGLAEIIGEALADQIKGGLVAIAETIDNQLETLLGEALDQAVQDTVVGPLAQKIYDNGPDFDESVLNPHLANSGPLEQALGALPSFDLAGDAAGVIEEIRSRLALLIATLDGAIALTEGDLPSNPALEAIFDFIFNTFTAAHGLEQELSEEEQEFVLAALLESADFGWVADAREALVHMRQRVIDIDSALATGGEFLDEINAVFDNLGSIVSDVREQVIERLETEMDGHLQEFSLEQIEELIRTAIRDRFFESLPAVSLQSILQARLGLLDQAVQETLTVALQAITQAVIDAILDAVEESTLAAIQDALGAAEDLLGVLSIVKAIGLNGEAMTCDDRIRVLCLQARAELGIPIPVGTLPVEFTTLFKYRELQSDGSAACGAPEGTTQTEVTMSASGGTSIGFGLDSTVNASLKFTFDENLEPTGFTGSFELDQSEFDAAGMGINDFSATLALGGPAFGEVEEFYLSAFASGNFGVGAVAPELEGGVALGRICDPVALAFYPDIPLDPSSEPVTGVVAYMAGKGPLQGGGCLYNITLGVGVGGYLTGSPGSVAFGGTLNGSLSGELFCLAKAEGTIGLQYDYNNSGSDYSAATHHFVGDATATIRLGRKPFVLEKSTMFGVEYWKTAGASGHWNVNP